MNANRMRVYMHTCDTCACACARTASFVTLEHMPWGLLVEDILPVKLHSGVMCCGPALSPRPLYPHLNVELIRSEEPPIGWNIFCQWPTLTWGVGGAAVAPLHFCVGHASLGFDFSLAE